MLDAAHLIDGRTAYLPHSLGNGIHAVNVRLADETAVSVDRQQAGELQVATGDEVLRFTPAAETKRLQLHQDLRRKCVIQLRGLDVPGAQPRLLVQAPGSTYSLRHHRQ